MKKFFWIAALFTVLALIMTGCPTGGGTDPIVPKTDDDDDDEDGEFTFWLASGEDGTKASSDTITLIGTGEEQYVYVFFTPPGVSFEKLKIDYTYGSSGTGFDMRWQCAYDASGTWGSVSGEPNYIGWKEKGPSECTPTTLFTQKWGSGHVGNAVDLTTIKGICFAVTVGINQEANFKLLSVELVGLDYKALLNNAITAAELLVETEYTSESWTALQTALTAAKAVAAKTSATTAEINSAKAALDAAIKALVPVGEVDKTALDALIATAKTKNEDDYTPGSWTAFSAVLAAAEDASASTSMGQTAINSAKDALQAAMDALAPRMYVSNFLYTGTSSTAVTSTVEIDTTGSNAGVTLSSGSIKVPSVTASKTETRLYLKIDPAVDITPYGNITFDWSGHGNASFNISLDMDGRRLLSADASGTSTTFDFVTDMPDWAGGWGDAAIGSLSGIEVYSESAAITELTISKITIAGDPVPSGEVAEFEVEFQTGVKKTATFAVSDFAKVEDDKITLTWNPDDEGGAFRCKFNFAGDAQVDLSSYSTFKFDWEIPDSSGWVGGNFNITLIFSGNRMLSSYVGVYDGTGTAEFDLEDDVPDWAAGTDWGGADLGILKGFEIYSNGEDFEGTSMVITKICFE